AKLEGKTRQQDVFEFLHRTESAGQFDLIFADPPYEHTSSGERYTDKLLQNLNLLGLLKDDGVFILEKRPGETLPEMLRWNLIRRKKYGATEVLFLEPNPARPNLPRRSNAKANPHSPIR